MNLLNLQELGSDANRLRKKWQDYSGRNASIAEQDFYHTFYDFFAETEFNIYAKPANFKNIYVDFPLDERTKQEIYTPPKKITRHGVYPDYAIENQETNKTIFIEVKRQDGWVEGGKRSDGRGNAHERSCKFFTPGLLTILREEGNIDDDNLPFWTVFIGDITRDPCRVREITCWYDDFSANFFMWRDTANKNPLIEHFINEIKPILE